ncbi:leucine rich repeat protein [Anaeramoeba flamelloides]|uniref:Leucine rich repeat protein n=1 Tax=Anaeramoeba flamelloides TaxID=1746091 RepID=A0ABQ8Z0W8_9EUKA|nr:leucine rich repeat protein [Anaeramoeba flamelloides]
MAIWVTSIGKDAWLISWIKDSVAIPMTSVIVSIANLVVILYFVFHSYIRGGGYCSKKMLKYLVNLLFRFFFFEWMLINAVSLFVTLSTFGLPELPFNNGIAFFITFTSALVHYSFLIYLYLKNKKFIHWNFIDLQIVLSPITLSLSLCVIIFGLNYTKYPNNVNNLLIAALILFVIVGIVVPFFIYYIFLRPLQKKKQKRILENQKKEKELEKWKMQIEIIKKCNESNESPNNIESLILVGLRITNITGLHLTPNLKRLYLTLNQIANINEIKYVSKTLEALHLEDNQISTFTDLLPLKNFHNLTNLTLERNPIIASSEFSISRLLALIPSLAQLNGQMIRKELYEDTIQENRDWLNNLETKHDLLQLKNYIENKKLKRLKSINSTQTNDHDPINQDIPQSQFGTNPYSNPLLHSHLNRPTHSNLHPHSNLHSNSQTQYNQQQQTNSPPQSTFKKIIPVKQLKRLKTKFFKKNKIKKSEELKKKQDICTIQEPNLNFSQNVSHYITTKNFAYRHNINYQRSFGTSFQMNSPLQNFTNHFDHFQMENTQLSQYKSYFNNFVHSLQNDQEEEQRLENTISWWTRFKNSNKWKFWKIRFPIFHRNN